MSGMVNPNPIVRQPRESEPQPDTMSNRLDSLHKRDVDPVKVGERGEIKSGGFMMMLRSGLHAMFGIGKSTDDIKSNQETLAAASTPEQRSELTREIQVLETFLPKAPSAAELVQLLGPAAEAIRAAAGPGPAMGVAMKFLKGLNVAAEARDVQAALVELRGKP